MAESPGGDQRYCTFYVGDERYGINILTVREVTRHVAFTPTRGAPSLVRGLLNLRGQLVTVIDPAVRFGNPRSEIREETRLLILKTNAELTEAATEAGVETSDDLVGIWVDRISDVVSAPAEELQASPTEGTGTDDLLSGVVQRSSGVLRIVDAAALINCDEAE